MGYCLERMNAYEDRRAIFRTTVSVIAPSGQALLFNGEVSGRILREARCLPQPKMPYSQIFVPDGEKLCWAEMDTEYENLISHRGKAFRLVREFLEKEMP